jgi:hypothetical protein
MRGHLLVCLLATTLLAGCAVLRDGPPTAVPPDRIENRAYQTPEPGDAHVIVERDNSFYAGGCDFRVLIQGTQLARIRPTEWLDLYLKPGSYILGATQGCGHSAVTEAKIQVQADEEKTYQLGTWSLWGGIGGLVITPITPPASQSNTATPAPDLGTAPPPPK